MDSAPPRQSSVKRESDGKAPTGKHNRIPVPALAVFALPHIPERWNRESSDPTVQKVSRAYFATIDALTEKQAKAIEAGVPTARVVRVPLALHIHLERVGRASRDAQVHRQLEVAVAAGYSACRGAPSAVV